MGEFDSNPVVKSLQSYHASKAYGASDGTMAGELGAADARREREARRKAEQSWSSSSSSSSDSSSKVICTELHRQGLMSRDDHERCARHAREHLTEQHYRGYHVWALSVVRHMRRSKRATAFWRTLAAARADHIAYLYGETSRRNILGALLCAIGHPACRLIGKLASKRDWRSLYAPKESGG
jgi:hypothetical protein